MAENREFKYELSIACGFASHAKNKNLTIDELIQTVDKKNVYRKSIISLRFRHGGEKITNLC